MTATQRFIEDAIRGGWRDATNLRLSAGYAKYDLPESDGWVSKAKTPIAEILIDPLAWQAVGKTRGWSRGIGGNVDHDKLRFLDFVDAIWSGKSIEEALAKTDVTTESV